jgi:hypothetical protein
VPTNAALATADRNGVAQASLSAHGFDASMIAELVNHGLAILTAEKGSEGGKRSAVAKVSITDAGRSALAGTVKARGKALSVLPVTRGSRMPAD